MGKAERDQARILFEEDGLTLKEISERLGLKYSTVKTWKSRDAWRQSETETPGRKKQNKGAVPRKGPPKGSQNARTHGLYSRTLPDSSRDVYEMVGSQDDADMLRETINVAVTNFLVAQKNPDVSLDSLSRAANNIANMVQKLHNIAPAGEDRELEKLDALIEGVTDAAKR